MHEDSMNVTAQTHIDTLRDKPKKREAKPAQSMNQNMLSMPGLNVEIMNNFLPGNDSKN